MRVFFLLLKKIISIFKTARSVTLSAVKKAFTDINTDFQLDNRKGAFSYFLLIVFEAIAISIFFPVAYETYDDAWMNAMVSGHMDGDRTHIMIFTNVIIGKILTFLYSVYSNLNWYTVYILSTLYLGYFAVQFSFYRLKSDYSVRIVRHLIILAALLFSLYVPSFTRAATVAAAGGFCLIFISKKRRPVELLLGAGLIILSSLVRYHVFIMYTALSLPIIFILFLKKRYYKILTVGLVIILAFLGKKYDESVYDANEEYLAFKIRNLANHNITEYNKPNIRYEDVKTELDSIGWSKNDFLIVRKGLYDVGIEKFDLANIQEVGEKNEPFFDLLTNPQIIKTLKETYREIWNYMDDRHFYFGAIFILLFLFVARNPYSLFSVLLYAIYLLLLAFYLHYFKGGELKIRVLVGLTFPFILSVLYFIDIHDKRTPGFFPKLLVNKQVFQVILLSLGIFVFLSTLHHNKDREKYRIIYRDRNHAYNKYIKNQNHEFCVYRIVTSPFYLYKNPFDLTNAYLLGWSIGTPANQKKIERYTGKSDVGIYSIMDKDIVWYFDPYLNSYKGDPNLVETFYKENFPYCDIKKEVLNVNGYKLIRHVYHIYSDSIKYMEAKEQKTIKQTFSPQELKRLLNLKIQ